MQRRILTLFLMIMLNGCSALGYQAAGCWFQNDEPRYSFALTWFRDVDPSFEPPTEDQWVVIERMKELDRIERLWENDK